MSLENKNIDQLFKEKLASQNFDVPASFLTDLENQLDAMAPTKRKKRAIYWWFLGLIPLFLLGYFSYSTFYTRTTNTDSNNYPPTKDVIKSSSQKLSTQNNKATTTSDLTSNNLKKDTDAFLETASNLSDTEKTNVEKNTSNNRSEQSDLSKSGKNKISKNNTTPKSNKNTTGYANLKTKHSQNSESTATIKGVESNAGDNQNNNTTNKDSKTIAQSNANTSSLADSLSTSNIISTELANIPTPLPETNTFIDTIKKTILIDSVVIRDSIIIVYDTVTFLDSSPLTVTKNVNVEAQLLFGTGLVKSIGTPNLTNTLDLFSQSKTRTYDIGFNLHFYWKKASLSTGFLRYNWGDYFKYSYTNINNHDSVYIDHYDEYLTLDTITNVFDTIFVPILDTLTISDTVNYHNSFVAYYNRLSIPLKLGYKFDYKTWSIIPRIGVNFEIRSRKEDNGIYIPGNFANNTPKRTSLSYMMQVEIRKNFNKRHVYLSPFYRKTASSLFDVNIGVGKYEVYGLHFGVGSKF